MEKLLWVFVFLGASALHSCTTTPNMGSCKNALVRYQQFDKKTGDLTLELVLVEETHEAFKDLHAQRRYNENIKKIPTQKFVRLIEILENHDFFGLATASLSGTAVQLPEVTKSIVVENDEGLWILTNTSEMALEDHKEFQTMIQRIRNCYDSVFSPQIMDSKEGEDLFFEEQRKLKEASRKRSHP